MADLKALGKRFNDEVFSQGKLDVVDEIVHEDFVDHEEMPPGIKPDRDGIKKFTTMFREAFPDIKVETIATAVDGDDLWMQSQFTGTHKGEFAGIPPTNKKVKVMMFDRVKTKDGKAIEHWGMVDNMAMMTQLGVIPEPG